MGILKNLFINLNHERRVENGIAWNFYGNGDGIVKYYYADSDGDLIVVEDYHSAEIGYHENKKRAFWNRYNEAGSIISYFDEDERHVRIEFFDCDGNYRIDPEWNCYKVEFEYSGIRAKGSTS